jgi:hypothetical protein
MSQSEQAASPKSPGVQRHEGSCHCGAARYEVRLDLGEGVSRCNCSICLKLGSTGVNVKPAAFRLLAGAEALGAYRVGRSTAARYFCKHCGVFLYGDGDIPELGGAFVSVNVNTLDGIEHADLQVGYWDGRHDNWAAGLRPTPWPVRPEAGRQGAVA